MAAQKLILVTGGAGFIGSHLCERLVKDGHKVISLDNYFVGSKENHVAGVEYREGHTKDIDALIPETPDLVYHLGEYSRVHKSLEEPELVWDMNVRGSEAVFEFCRKKNSKVVYAASSTKSAVSHETAGGGSTRNVSPYTWAKAANVDLLTNYGAWFKLPHAIVYFYNVYGPRERAWGSFGTVIETFRQNFLQGLPHKVNAPGTQTRSFTHVLDTIDGIILAGEKGEGDGLNIASRDVHSILDVAEMFGGAVEMHPQTKTSRSSGTDDTSKIESLGWKQQRHLADYIAEEKKKKV